MRIIRRLDPLIDNFPLIWCGSIVAYIILNYDDLTRSQIGGTLIFGIALGTPIFFALIGLRWLYYELKPPPPPPPREPTIKPNLASYTSTDELKRRGLIDEG